MRTSLAFIVAVLVSFPCLAAGKPLPPKEQIDAAKQLVAETFSKELSQSDKAPAVKAMLETASKTEGDDPAQAALYLSAAEVAARIGDTRLAFDAVDQLANVFDVDALQSKATLLEISAKNSKTNEIRMSVANRGLELAGAACSASRFELADSALKAAASVSSKLRDADLRKELAAKRRELEKARKAAQHDEAELADARKKLDAHPDDPAANEAYGKFLCFDRNDWMTGLKHLAKSPDANLRNLATADAKGASNGTDSAKLGDAWYALASKSDSQKEQSGYKSRAAFWYTRATSDLKGFAKTRVEKRLSEMAEAVEAAASQAGGENGKYVDLTLVPGVLLRLVKIPASADGKVKEFYLGQTEVTQRQWMAVMGSNPSTVKGDSLPVTDVSQKDCQDFAARLSERGRFAFRLPTKEEWLHAYDADVRQQGVNVSSVSWNKDNASGKIHGVAQKECGKLNLFDIAGNAFELTDDPVHIYGGSVSISMPANGSCFVQNVQSGAKHAEIGFRLCAETR